MAQEPEKEIEKLLREHAEKRRADAGEQVELHPATRRMLQGEILRTFGANAGEETPEEPTRKSGVGVWLWRLVWLGCFAVLVMVVSVVWVRNRPQNFALREAYSEGLAMTPPPPASPSSSAAAPAPAAAAVMDSELAQNLPEAKPSELLALDMKKQQQPGIAGDSLRESNVALSVNSPTPSKDAYGTTTITLGASVQQQPPIIPEGGALAYNTRQMKAIGGARAAQDEAENRARMADSSVAKKLDAAKTASAPAPAERTLAEIPPPAAKPALQPSESRMTLAAPSVAVSSRSESSGALMPDKGVAADRLSGDKQTAAKAKRAMSEPVALEMQANVSGAAMGKAAADQADFTQNYTQTVAASSLRRNFQSPPLPPVLNSFQVQRSGNELRLIDADGSVYVGQLVPVLADAVNESLEKEEAAKAEEKSVSRKAREKVGEDRDSVALGARFRAAPASQMQWSFTATGVNRTLNQRVVVQGGFYGPVQNAQVEQKLKKAQPALRGGAIAEAEALPALQIQGRVQVGPKEELRLNALPVQK